MHFRLVTQKSELRRTVLDEGTTSRSLRGEHRGMKFLAAEFLRFSVPRAAPYGEALTPAANAIFFLPASGYKRTKIRCRDESYSLCPVVLLRTTFRSRQVSCRCAIIAVPLTFPTFLWKNISLSSKCVDCRYVIHDNRFQVVAKCLLSFAYYSASSRDILKIVRLKCAFRDSWFFYCY